MICRALFNSCFLFWKKSSNPNHDSHKGHEFVDLGLQSGTLWATCNVGANSPDEYGDYFAWGETKPQKSNSYSWKSYKFGNDYENLNKYNKRDGKTELDQKDDAAYVNWGGKWCMPSVKHFEELIRDCYWVWTTSYGKNLTSGYIVYKAKSEMDKGKMKNEEGEKGEYNSLMIYNVTEDVHIFLPAAGYRYNGYIYGGGGYFSRSLHGSGSSRAWYLYFNSFDVRTSRSCRDGGQSVRPVCPRAD